MTRISKESRTTTASNKARINELDGPRFEGVLFEAGADSWSDDAKITTLVSGLNKETRQRLDGQLTLPVTYDAFVRMMMTLGSRFGQSYEGRSNDNGYSRGRASSKNNGNAMEWEQVHTSAAKVAPVASREQRQAWRDTGKCVRCGSKNHWVNRCKYQATRSRSSSASSAKSMDSSDTDSKPRAMAVRVNNVSVQGGRTKTTAKSLALGNSNDSDDSNGHRLHGYLAWQPPVRSKVGGNVKG
jgi:hypothetical protein